MWKYQEQNQDLLFFLAFFFSSPQLGMVYWSFKAVIAVRWCHCHTTTHWFSHLTHISRLSIVKCIQHAMPRLSASSIRNHRTERQLLLFTSMRSVQHNTFSIIIYVTTKASSYCILVTVCWWRCHTLAQLERIAHCIHVWQNRRLWAKLNTLNRKIRERTSYDWYRRAVYGLIIQTIHDGSSAFFLCHFISFHMLCVCECSTVLHQANTDVKSSHPRSINSSDSITNTRWERKIIMERKTEKFADTNEAWNMRAPCRTPALI